ncbi:MAG TPA: bacillithiol biosynthesis deacetylase BshB1 [Cyclobacteriaceae bacterium]|nr:bacillithiol biosynthesis deacetylase BshB1 [Cyclobacteriaceae bacterium]
MKLDILVFAAHPDDAELSCGGTIALQISKGHTIGMVDLTRGEIGTRGTPEIRAEEAANAAKILGLSVRENAGLEDGFIQNNKENQLRIAAYVRKYRPEIVLTNAVSDRHPDHGRAAALTRDACYIAGLVKLKINPGAEHSGPWRPKALYHYIQSDYIDPDFIVDISGFWKSKLDAIRAHKSQFFDPKSTDPETYISNPLFLEFIEARCKQWGHAINAVYGEGFTVERTIGIRNLADLL